MTSSGSVDLAVRGGIVVDGTGLRRLDVLIDDELIVDLVAPGVDHEAKQVFDARGRYVLPGIVDAHHHPVYSDRIETLSASAAIGGTTTVVGFIGAVKAWGGSGTLVDAVKAFVEEGEESSHIDFSAHGSLVHDDVDLLADSIPQLVEMGVTSFKGFMAYAKRGMKLEDAELIRAMAIIADNGGLFAVHAENGALLDHLQDGFIGSGRISPEYWAPSAPNLAETEAVLRIMTLAGAVRCPLYLVHLSARQTMDIVRLWRRWGEWRVFAETCPHFLTLTNADLLARGSLGKVGPPLREQPDVEALWEAVADGTIDVIATDFAGHTIEKKQPAAQDIFSAPAGLPGIGDLLTVVHDAGVNPGRITMPRLVQVLCEQPARIFGMFPKKGALLPGSDGDLVVFDPARSHLIRAPEQALNTDYSMWEGRECLGYPTLVVQRGRVIVEDGELKAAPGHGKFIARGRASSEPEEGAVA